MPMYLLPPPPGVCQECAVQHDPSQPHNKDSLYYQYSFFARHNRWPTWRDAIAHCDQGTQKLWIDELTKRNVKID